MADFTIVVLPGAHASGVSITLDMLHTAVLLAPRLSLPAPTWRVVSPDGGEVALSSGLRCAAAPMPKQTRRDASTWIFPGLAMATAAHVEGRLREPDAQTSAAALARHLTRGGTVAAACSAVFLLWAADELKGRRVTTTWWLAPELQRLEPACTVDADHMLCIDGNVITAGAAMAQADLMLHLLRENFGAALADDVRKVLLLDARTAQAPFVIPSMMSNGDELVRRLMRRIENALPDPPSVSDLADDFAMSSRTLSRRVRAATGKSPLTLIQTVRLSRARMLIETSRMTIEQIAEQVGYEDATALRRLMRKRAGTTPGQFRQNAFRDTAH